MHVSSRGVKVWSVIDERPGGAHYRRPRPGLDFDDVRAVERQEVTAICPGQAGVQFEHPDTFERRAGRPDVALTAHHFTAHRTPPCSMLTASATPLGE